MDDNYWIPRNLDAPPLFFMWEVDIAAIWVICFVIGGVMNMLILGAACAIFFGRIYGRIKEEGGKGLIAKLMYWYTPSDVWLSKQYPSHVREYLGG